MYSALPLHDVKINYLVEDDIPSVHALVEIAPGTVAEIYGIHPRPPRPKTDSTERDAELIVVAKRVRQSKNPVLVFGDLNDVAWSHTSRLFRRISKLLDPRIGRGPFVTFPVYLPGMRFPLDYVFHSNEFRYLEMERLPEFGSDHFPLFATFSFEPEKKMAQPEPETEPGDLQEGQEKIEKVRP